MFVRFVCLLTLPWPGETDGKFLQSAETWFANLGKLSSDCGDLSGVSCSDAAVSYFHCRPIALFFFLFLQSMEAVEFPAADTHLNLRITVENCKINKFLLSAGSYGPCRLQDLFP